MNLQKLFAAQAELDKHIYEQHPVEDGEDRLAKKILALQVELGECANEWRGFRRTCIQDQFRTLFHHSSMLSSNYVYFFEHLIGLGEILGFTWSQIEQAYFEKNAVNHKRQETGY